MLDNLWEKIDDASWKLAAGLHLDSILERYNLPPIILPIAIIVVIIALLLLLSAPASYPSVSGPCGDGSCDATKGEDIISCPADCAPRSTGGRSVTVELIGDIKGEVRVTLYDSDANEIKSLEGSKSTYTFPNVNAQRVKVIVLNTKNMEHVSSDFVNLDSATITIPLVLPRGFFDEQVAPPKASILVSVRDAITGSPIPARVSILVSQSGYFSVITSEDIDGLGSFQVDSNQWYSIVAEADNYRTYDTKNNPIQIAAGDERTIEALLEPLTEQQLTQPSQVQVCVVDEAGVYVAGNVDVQTLGGLLVSEQPLVDGCTYFELAAGATYTVIAYPAGSCTTSSQEIIPVSDEDGAVIVVTCGSTGRTRLKVLNETGNILTNSANISARYSNGSQIFGTGDGGFLKYNSSGYTEFVTVSSSANFYFVVTGLPGYAIYQSNNYAVSANQNLSINVTLERAVVSEYDFTFNGIAYPDPVLAGSQFQVVVPSIYYGYTQVTQLAQLAVGVAGAPCTMNLTNFWTATCTAPASSGVYDIAFSATYEGAGGVYVSDITVLNVGTGAYFELIPYPIEDKDPPITLTFTIKFNNTILNSLDDSKVSVFYDDGGVMVADNLELSGSNGVYSVSVSTPFPGTHHAVIRLTKIAGDSMYEQDFVVYFESEPASVRLTTTSSISPRILSPQETFHTYVTVKSNNVEVANLTNLRAKINGVMSTLSWDGATHVYTGTFTAPGYEGIYLAEFFLEYQKLSEKKYYVVDTQKTQSSSCPIQNCQTISEVRKCVDGYRTAQAYSEEDTIECIESGWFGDYNLTHCLSGGAYRGDWYRTCKLDSADTAIMSEILTKVPDSQDRNTFAGCGDMNNDGTVNETDKTCLINIISGKWYGDSGTTITPIPDPCPEPLNGGFCYDIGTSSPFKGDFNDNGNIEQTDIDLMSNILEDVQFGVTTPQELLDFVDFDQNGLLDEADKICLESYMDIDIEQMIENAQRGIVNMPDFDEDCLNIYNISCSGLKGDLNGDRQITELDLMILGFIVSDIGSLFTGAAGETLSWTALMNVNKGATVNLSTPIPFGSDWIIEAEGNFNFDNSMDFFCDPAIPRWDEGGRLSTAEYNNNLLPGQTLQVSPSVIFSLDWTNFNLVAGYKGVAMPFGAMTLQTVPSSTNTLRIEYYHNETRVRIYWDGKLVGHFDYEEKSDAAFNAIVFQLFFEDFGGSFRYYVGDLDPYMTKYGSLECADINEDGVIDEYDFACMSVMLSGGGTSTSEFCKSCTQTGIEEGWYSVKEICGDGYDNDCDTTIDIGRAGSRTDVNMCDCPFCWAHSGYPLDLDGGAGPGIDDGNYAVCMAMTWPSADAWDNMHPAFEAHWVRQDAPDAMNRPCTLDMQCHFYLCYDNYEICAYGSDWRQFGGGASHENPASTREGDIYRIEAMDYAPKDSGTYPLGSSNQLCSEGTSRRLSMDNLHSIGQKCYDENGNPLGYYGVWGDFLSCEGESSSTFAEDEWDNNCWCGDAEPPDPDCEWYDPFCWFD